MSFVQSVIPISAALIIVAEMTYLADLVVAKRPPGRPAVPLAESAQ